MPSQRQALLRKFYADFGTRIAFIREKRGIGLAELGGGKASTAKSWEDGSCPAPRKWDEVAKRLGVSASFVFRGEPRLQADYDFVAKFGDEIGPPPHATVLHAAVDHYDAPSAVHEEQAPYGALREVTTAEAEAGEAEDIADRIRSRVEATIAAAGKDIGRLGWIREQAEQYLRTPEHWARGLPEPKRRPATVVLVPRPQALPQRHGQSSG